MLCCPIGIYAMGEQNTNVCPSSSTRITTKAECEAAAADVWTSPTSAAGNAATATVRSAQPRLLIIYICCPPSDPAGMFREGAEVIKLHIEGSLTPTIGMKRVSP